MTKASPEIEKLAAQRLAADEALGRVEREAVGLVGRLGPPAREPQAGLVAAPVPAARRRERPARRVVLELELRHRRDARAEPRHPLGAREPRRVPVERHAADRVRRRLVAELRVPDGQLAGDASGGGRRVEQQHAVGRGLDGGQELGQAFPLLLGLPVAAAHRALDARLRAALGAHSVKDAAAIVSGETGLPRRRVYARALQLAKDE